MPSTTLMALSALLLSFCGFAALSLAMDRHQEDVLGRALAATPSHLLRATGTGLLVLALRACMAGSADLCGAGRSGVAQLLSPRPATRSGRGLAGRCSGEPVCFLNFAYDTPHSSLTTQNHRDRPAAVAAADGAGASILPRALIHRAVANCQSVGQRGCCTRQ
ncbi:MAG: DUF3325 domain-containing protein [Comamonas sp.]